MNLGKLWIGTTTLKIEDKYVKLSEPRGVIHGPVRPSKQIKSTLAIISQKFEYLT